MEVIERAAMRATPQSNTSARADTPSPPELAAALDLLWVRFLPDIRSRAGVLSAAAAACASASLQPEQREAAHAAAHKLAGTLGTFSLARGTELARELEHAFAGQMDVDPVFAARLASVAGELRAIIDSRK